MAFQIDLNEAPLPSPRDRQPNDASFASSTFHVCSVCRKAVSAGRRVDVVTEEQRKAFKCFNCLLTSSSGVREGGGGFDINASPPREAEGDGVAVGLGGRRGAFRCGKTVASTQITSSSHRFTTINSMLDNFPRTSSLVADLASSGFQSMSRQMHSGGNFGIVGNRSSFDGGTQPNLTSSAHAPDSPNTVYLNILREYIAERNGFLGEGWHVEFAFCDKRYKTSAVYITPDGNRLKSMKDVARHLGLTPNYHCIETGNGIGGISKSGVNIDTSNKGYAANSTARNCIGDGIHSGFPVQFQDFCLMSAGNIDLRPSYHNTRQIFPVGYRSSWHDRITGSLFVCVIADGGDFGPIYKVYRYPCSKQSIPVSKTILSKTKLRSGEGDNRFGEDDSVTFQVADDDSSSVMALLNEDSPPCLDVTLSEKDNLSDSHIKCLVQRTGNSEASDLNDVEFQVECRSSSSAWEKVSQAFLYAFHEKFKQNGSVKFFCDHDIVGTSNENLESIDSLSIFFYSLGPIDIPPLIQNEDMFKTTCEKLYTWLNRDRFGLDADFVHEIIEKLPGVTACSEYKSLNLRKESEALQTIGSGFFQAERRTSDVIGTRKWSKLQSGDKIAILKRDPCPPGKSLNSKLPLNLIGDVLQVWELAWRFLDVLGLGEPFSFQELESEILGASFGSYPHETTDTDDAKGEKDSEAGLLLTKIISSLLKLLVCELLSKVAAYACPNLDVGEFKTRKGKKKDYNGLKKTKLDMLPVNELTWHEIARRYILAVFSVEGNLDSTEIASRESGKIFHCLQGDGGLLCGCLTGIAALQADAMVLADAMKHIFGCSLKSKNEIVSISEKQDACGDQKIDLNDDDDVMPEWTQALEPVRKLPTNVGARIRKCVNEALEKNPPEWAKTILERSISKEVYKGNASGPTKRAVVSVLDKVSKENPVPKSEKKEKKKIKTNVTDLISKQCRIVLRRAAAADEERVFCNLLGRSTLNRNDNDDEGLLGNPAMVSRPLDFRTIDLRLAAGVYDGSREAFLDDVREVWSNVRTVYTDWSDLIDVAENLSHTFEDLYEKEVQTLVNKIVEASSDNGERDELLADVAKSSIPRAPWEEGICKTCGMDKDDDNVLLCDKCDSEYHGYCLNPPLLKIPEGNWFCPACVSGRSVPSSAVYGFFGNQNRKRRYEGEFVRKFLEGLTRLAKLMDVKEFLEFNVDEKTFFLKFLFDEVLNTAAIHEHLEHCASRTSELQQKLRHLTSEMKMLKFKEEMLVLNADKENSLVCSGSAEVQSEASSSFLTNTSESPNQSQNRQLLRGQSQPENIFSHAPILRRHSCKNDQNSLLSTNQATPGHNSSGSNHERQDKLPDMATPQDNNEKTCTIKNEISEMQKSIASADHELIQLSLRKDFLGRDCNDRIYWAFHSHNARAWIIANGSLSSDKKLPEEFIGISDSDKWMSYETNKEIEELFRWLRDDDVREKELKEAILQLQNNKSKDGEYTEKHVLAREETKHLTFSNRTISSSNDSLASKALRTLETKFGPCTRTVSEDDYQNLASGSKIVGKLFRCKCLEPLWDSRSHCLSCHRTFLNDEQLKQHSTDCKTAMASTAKRSMPTEDSSSRKKLKIVISAGKIVQMTDNQNDGSGFSKRHLEPDCPFKLEEIMSRFIVPDSLKGEANSIGLIGSGGVPSLLPNGPWYYTDSALTWGPTRTTDTNSADMHGDFRSRSLIEESNTLSRSAENGLREREQVFSVGDKSSFYWLTRSSMTSESSSRKLVGRASEILRVLKINLLDMDAALPEDALRPSRSCEDRRCAWRAFVKSASSIYEMVEATLILEDAIKSNFLSNNWWYWSSPSTAAKISTLSALSLRIYALDSAICYEKPIASGASEEQNSTDPSSPPLQKTPEPDYTENPRTRSRASKRRKDI